ncbi:hypothetical protein NDU88_003293 [Pleurodeles waltl]|uniref:Uncharacterized protein n=1 Tax=Pleurodeles waltl TaxID=8319 RepID=A0AAV7VCY3_PLEWA|nr:hypothetical protein NDU88_003293 [Pleurodeles waltl]
MVLINIMLVKRRGREPKYLEVSSPKNWTWSETTELKACRLTPRWRLRCFKQTLPPGGLVLIQHLARGESAIEATEAGVTPEQRGALDGDRRAEAWSRLSLQWCPSRAPVDRRGAWPDPRGAVGDDLDPEVHIGTILLALVDQHDRGGSWGSLWLRGSEERASCGLVDRGDTSSTHNRREASPVGWGTLGANLWL